MSYQQLCYRSLWEERERVNQTTKCRLIPAQGTWERCFRCLLKVGHTEQTTSMYIYTSYPGKKCTAKSNALLHCKYQLSVLMNSAGHSIHSSFHMRERQRLQYICADRQKCRQTSISPSGVDLCTILFPRMHGRAFPQRTDIFWAFMQSKPLWTKQIKGGVWTWPGVEAPKENICGNCSPPGLSCRSRQSRALKQGAEKLHQLCMLVSCLMFLSIVSSDL